MRNHEDLLDRLQRELGCAYLSDVKQYGLDAILGHLAQIPPAEYSLFMWVETIAYLTGSQPHITSEADLNAFLRSRQ